MGFDGWGAHKDATDDCADRHPVLDVGLRVDVEAHPRGDAHCPHECTAILCKVVHLIECQRRHPDVDAQPVIRRDEPSSPKKQGLDQGNWRGWVGFLMVLYFRIERM